MPEGSTVQRPLISALVTALLVVLLGIGSLAVGMTPATGAASTASTAPAESSRDLETDLTLRVSRCEDCVVTLFSYDGLSPIYSSAPAVVSEGSVTFRLPSARTSGMSVQVDAPWSDSRSDTYVAWRYSGRAIGEKVSLAGARASRRASGCWAGTVNEAVTLKIKVRRVRHRGRATAIAWAPVTESFVRPMERVRRGLLMRGDVLACNLS